MLVHSISFASVDVLMESNVGYDAFGVFSGFQRNCNMQGYLQFGCRQNYLHVAYSHLPISLKYRTDLLYSGIHGFGGV